MADNYLITGYWGEAHVTPENDRGINAGIFGPNRVVLPVGEEFNAEYIGNNTVRMYDGKLVDAGAAAGIPAGEYIDLLIASAGQNKKRNDLIVFQYEKDASTGVETGKFVVVQGTEVSINSTPRDPALTQNDLLPGDATFDQMPLWRVSVTGTTISSYLERVYTKALISIGEIVRLHGDLYMSGYDNGEYRSHYITGLPEPVNVTDAVPKYYVDDLLPSDVLVGYEYETKEKYGGRTVYTKLIHFGNLPNASTGYVYNAVPTNATVIRMSGYGLNSTYNLTIPFYYPNASISYWVITSSKTLNIRTESDRSTMDCYVQLWYVKS